MRPTELSSWRRGVRERGVGSRARGVRRGSPRSRAHRQQRHAPYRTLHGGRTSVSSRERRCAPMTAFARSLAGRSCTSTPEQATSSCCCDGCAVGCGSWIRTAAARSCAGPTTNGSPAATSSNTGRPQHSGPAARVSSGRAARQLVARCGVARARRQLRGGRSGAPPRVTAGARPRLRSCAPSRRLTTRRPGSRAGRTRRRASDHPPRPGRRREWRAATPRHVGEQLLRHFATLPQSLYDTRCTAGFVLRTMTATDVAKVSDRTSWRVRGRWDGVVHGRADPVPFGDGRSRGGHVAAAVVGDLARHAPPWNQRPASRVDDHGTVHQQDSRHLRRAALGAPVRLDRSLRRRARRRLRLPRREPARHNASHLPSRLRFRRCSSLRSRGWCCGGWGATSSPEPQPPATSSSSSGRSACSSDRRNSSRCT